MSPIDLANSSAHLANPEPECGVPRKIIPRVYSRMFCKCLSALFLDARRAYIVQLSHRFDQHKEHGAYILTDKATQAVSNEYDWTIVLVKSVTHPLRESTGEIPTASLFSRCDATAASKFLECWSILFWEVTARQSRTDASYPNVRIRARGSFVGNNVWGQGVVALSAVHVFSRCPVSPWMNTMLKIRTTISNASVAASREVERSE
jgi:hypothetical protein